MMILLILNLIVKKSRLYNTAQLPRPSSLLQLIDPTLCNFPETGKPNFRLFGPVEAPRPYWMWHQKKSRKVSRLPDFKALGSSSCAHRRNQTSRPRPRSFIPPQQHSIHCSVRRSTHQHARAFRIPPPRPQSCRISPTAASASLKLSPSSSSIMSDACKNAIGRSVQSRRDVYYAGGSVTVRPARAAACVLLADV